MTQVTFFMPDLSGGGAERVTLDLCADLQRRGHSVRLLVANLQGQLGTRGEASFPFEVTDLRSRRTATAAGSLARQLRRHPPDVLVAVLAHAGLVAVLARRLAGTGTPLIVVQHNTMSINSRESPRWRDRLVPALCRVAYRRKHTLVAVSHGVADDLARTTGLPRDRVEVLANPVDFARIRALGAASAEDGPHGHSSQTRLVAVGRLVPQKDYVTLLQAVARLDPSVTLQILGEGPERPLLERTIRELGLGDRVSMPGFVPNPYPHIRQADVLVMSSRWEGLPTVLLEALAFETRIVSTDCPSGPREILGDGVYGSLTPVSDARALADAIEAELADTSPADRTEVRAAYDAGRAVEMFESLLERVVGRGGP
jgi:glycosyltransferase involved in cell wall biosynthesis